MSSVAVKRPAATRRGLTRRQLTRNLEGWLCVSPWVVGFLFFTAGPLLASAGIAATVWDLIASPRFVGLANFQRAVLVDPAVWTALRVTTTYAVVSVPLQLGFGLALALLLNARVRGQSIYRTIYYLPAVLSGVAVALLWRWIFAGDFGLLNAGLALVGIDGPGWLTDRAWALPALMLMSLWSVGAGMVVYLAGLQGIPTDLYEAAQVDGAGAWARLRHITVPVMTPVLFFQLVIGLIRALQVFTEAYVMTKGGPGDATLFFMLYLYRNAFESFRMGYAAALAWILFLYILLLTALVFRSSRVWVHYEGDLRGRGG
jgi:multiple sugar transport system permease protein